MEGFQLSIFKGGCSRKTLESNLLKVVLKYTSLKIWVKKCLCWIIPKNRWWLRPTADTVLLYIFYMFSSYIFYILFYIFSSYLIPIINCEARYFYHCFTNKAQRGQGLCLGHKSFSGRTSLEPLLPLSDTRDTVFFWETKGNSWWGQQSVTQSSGGCSPALLSHIPTAVVTLRKSWAVRYDIKVSLTDVILKSKFSFYVIGQKDWGVCTSHLAHNLVVVVDRELHWGTETEIPFLSLARHMPHTCELTIILTCGWNPYKLLKKVVNINTEKKPGYLWEVLCVSIHHGTIFK